MEKTILKSKSHTDLHTNARQRELSAKRHLHTIWTDDKIQEAAAIELLQPDARLIGDILKAARTV